MPLNPLENLPASFIKQNIIVNKYTENFKELKINELKESKTEGYMNVVSTDNLNSTVVPCHIPPLTPHTNKSKHIEVSCDFELERFWLFSIPVQDGLYALKFMHVRVLYCGTIQCSRILGVSVMSKAIELCPFIKDCSCLSPGKMHV